MKKFYFFVLLLMGILTAAMAQGPVVSFNCMDDNGNSQRLDSVRIDNWTRSWSVTIYYPNLSISLGDIHTGITELEFDEEGLAQNIPNPFDGRTRAQLTLATSEHILMRVYDMTGRIVAYYEGQLESGKHEFNIVLSTPQTYILQVASSRRNYTIKMVNTGKGGEDKISLMSSEEGEMVLKSAKQIMDYDFEVGDCMNYQGFVTLNGAAVRTEPLVQNQYDSEQITLRVLTQQTTTVPVGVYAGVVGFNNQLYVKPIGLLDNSSINAYHSFINTLPMGNGTILYHADYTALNNIASSPIPDELINVTLVTFTDGLDLGSWRMNPIFTSETAYLNAVHNRIMNDELGGVHITAYAIGLKGSDVTDTARFRYDLRMLSSDPDHNALEVSNISEVNAQFREVAAQLNSASLFTTDITLLLPAPDPGTRVRFTFDNVTSAENSYYYIDATYTFSNGVGILSDIVYEGLTSTSGTVVTGVAQGIFDRFVFTDIKDNLQQQVSTSNIKQWYYVPSTQQWQRNSEFTTSNTTTSQQQHNSAMVMLVLDCSSSLGSGFSTMKSSANNFLDILRNSNTLSAPTVQTQQAITVTDVSANLRGTVTNSGNLIIHEKGFVVSLSPNMSNASYYISSGTSTDFSYSLTGLSPNTTYYYKAYARNNRGIGYGNTQSFTTPTMPSVTTAQVSGVTGYTAVCGGTVTSTGNATATRGVCWSTSQSPTVSDSHTNDGSGSGSYTSTLSGLNPGTTYYVRAYVTNIVGTAYGEQRSFTTSVVLPTVTTNDVTDNVGTTATCGGNVTSTGGGVVTARGICWGTSQNPTISNSHSTNGSGSGSFTSSMVNLTPGTTYYVRAYATNSAGTAYGEQKTFTTPNTPTVTTNTVSSITATTATCGGNVTATGGANVTARGVCWSTSQNPTISSSHTTDGNGTGSFTSNITGLQPNTTYYVRAYATNSAGTSYGTQRSFTTPVTTPTVTTNNTINNITGNGATTGGNVTATGGASVTARGVCWSTSQNPTLNDSHTSNGSGTGSFTSNLTDLQPETTYYVRAYATNSAGTAYGNSVSFTIPFICSATITDIDGNTYHTLQLGNQCWMKENLKTTHYANGTSIALGSSTSTSTAYRYNPNNNATNVATYGYLYNWKAVMRNSSSSSANPSGVQGICPNGWHVPSDAEWIQLTDFVSGQSQYVCGNDNTNIAKALASSTGWNSSTTTCATGNNSSTNNATIFSALPAGGYNSDYYGFGNLINIWSATENNGNFAYISNLFYNSTIVRIDGISKSYGYSVRCLRNDGFTVSLPTISTTTVSQITENSAVGGGTITSTGGGSITARGLCWSTFQNPTISDSHTTNGNGTGSFTGNITGLTPGTTYYVRAYATNSVGTAYGNTVSFTTPFTCGGITSDIDGNTYQTLQLGNQCWMKENLRTTHYADGTSIALSSSTSTTTAYRYNPNDDANNVPSYGYLYNWPAVMHGANSSANNPSGVQGICPNGWHVPSHAEWRQLSNYVSGQSQYVCGDYNANIAKALASITGWISRTNTCAVGNNPSENNATGFSALPSGKYTHPFPTGDYLDFGFRVYFWSTTKHNDGVYYRVLSSSRSFFNSNRMGITAGLSIRCVRNDGFTVSLPTLSTDTVLQITDNSAIMEGRVLSDGGGNIINRGVCWSTSQNPTVNDDYTSNGSGTGNFSCSMTGLQSGYTYYARTYATNSAGTEYGEQMSFTTISYSSANGHSCPNESTIIDYDGNSYNTVKLGNQCWMKENLRVTHYSDGVPIALGTDTSSTTPYRYNPDEDESNVSMYGYLYNWPAVMRTSLSSNALPSGVQGVCPSGWHVPSSTEWMQLEHFVRNQGKYVCGDDNSIAKALADNIGWVNLIYNDNNHNCETVENPNTNNATGFSALPAGTYPFYSVSEYDEFGFETKFWSTTEIYYPNNSGFNCRIYWNHINGDGNRSSSMKYEGLSVRCLRNFPINLYVTTNILSNITATTAICGGDVSSNDSSIVVSRGVCWSTLQNPTISDNHTINGSGTGSFTSNITGLTSGTTYYVRAYIINNSGTEYGDQRCFTTISSTDGQPCSNAATVTDYDGNSYNTIQLGSQCWMKENLKTTHYADGTSIALGNSTSSTTAYRYYPDNDSANVSSYGYLYNWKAVMNESSSSETNPSFVQGICPNGWHMPSDAEWSLLTDYISSQSQNVSGNGDNTRIAKALAATTGWNGSTNLYAVGNNPNANNITGFTAFPAGYSYGFCTDMGSGAYYWCATEFDNQGAYFRAIMDYHAYVERYSMSKYFGHSVRCILNKSGYSESLPTVSITIISQITDNSAVIEGSVISDGGATITARGVCWSTSENPTVMDSHTSNGSGTGSFTSNITGLQPGTTYYARAYATNSVGTAYGEQVSFTTQIILPTVSTEVVSEITAITAVCGGNVTATGGADVIARGVCWGTSQNPTISNSHTTNGNGLGSFTSNITGLSHNTTYYVRAYATNSAGTAYGEQRSFMTPTVPTVSTTTVSSITGISAVSGGNVTSDGRATVTARGVCWSTSHNPTTNDRHTTDGTGTGVFTSNLTELSPNTTYYVRAYATNLVATSYGEEISFTTPIIPPTVSTNAVSNITPTSATCGGNVTATGGANVTARGICWSTSQNPTINDSHTTDGSGTGSYTSSITGLTYGTTYYVRAYATNGEGTSYGAQQSFIAGPPCPGTTTVTDYDGNIYGTIQIGNQCWMKENLRTTHYANGTAIALGSSIASHTAYRYYPNNNSANVSTYGYLYNWTAVMKGASSSSANPSGVQGICPNGWHIPSNAEWTQLNNYVKGQSQYVCGSYNTSIAKALSAATSWSSSSTECAVGNNLSINNKTGFSALPAGCYSRGYNSSGYTPADYRVFGLYASFWSSTLRTDLTEPSHLHTFTIRYNSASTYNGGTNSTYSRDSGISVRCLKD